MNISPIGFKNYSNSVNFKAKDKKSSLTVSDNKDGSSTITLPSSVARKAMPYVMSLMTLAGAYTLVGCSKDGNNPVTTQTEQVDSTAIKIAAHNKAVADIYVNYLGLLPTKTTLPKTASSYGDIPSGTLTKIAYKTTGNVIDAGETILNYSPDLTNENESVYTGRFYDQDGDTSYVKEAYSTNKDGTLTVKCYLSSDNENWESDGTLILKKEDGVVKQINTSEPNKPTTLYPVDSKTIKGKTFYGSEFIQDYSNIEVK